jgi:hypothetical protein
VSDVRSASRTGEYEPSGWLVGSQSRFSLCELGTNLRRSPVCPPALTVNTVDNRKGANCVYLAVSKGEE